MEHNLKLELWGFELSMACKDSFISKWVVASISRTNHQLLVSRPKENPTLDTMCRSPNPNYYIQYTKHLTIVTALTYGKGK